ncbi:MAG TPA: HYR domain-containing protein, partial [Candidatus Acidoferrum sp.]|nr:HYR domain-containing protein [Candidatus Acidoferrum sp.]
APTIACSTNKIVELGTPWTFDPPTSTDLSSNAISIVSTVTNAGTCGNGYVAIRTWRATDACSNSNQCSQTVTVLDRTAPTITCSTNKIVEAGTAWEFDPPTATDLSSNGIVIVSTITTPAGCNATASRTWRATDACGNSSTCRQMVTILDRTAPAIVCATNKTVELGTVWAFDPPTATDVSDFTVSIVSTITNASAACGSGFVAVQTWRATDDCGNTSDCSQVVTVLDRTAPTIICPTNKVVELGSVWSFDPPTVTDLSSNGISIVSTVTNAGTCGNGFVAIRTWRATDVCGNSNQCSQTVTVLDRTAPTITCSPNKTVEAGVAWTFDPPIVSDLSSFTITIASTTTNLLCGGSFNTTRAWIATDACGNSNTCQQTVTVHDGTAPTVSVVSPTNGQVFIAPATISIVAAAFDAGGVASVQFYANSNLLTTVSNAPYFFVWSNVPLGTNRLVAVATDFCGLSTTSSVVTIFVTTNTLFAAGPIVLNRQNGLFEQYLTVWNLTAETWPNGVRVFVDIDTTNKVWNATGTNSLGVPYLDKVVPIPAGGTVEVLVQYYVPDVRSVPKPNIVAVPLPYVKAAPVAPKILALKSGAQCDVTFETTSGQWYFLQRSEDLKTWTTDPTPIHGTGAACQWPQNNTVPLRFYRVLLVP